MTDSLLYSGLLKLLKSESFSYIGWVSHKISSGFPYDVTEKFKQTFWKTYECWPLLFQSQEKKKKKEVFLLP